MLSEKFLLHLDEHRTSSLLHSTTAEGAVISELPLPVGSFNPLPLLFKTLLHGQKECVSSAGI